MLAEHLQTQIKTLIPADACFAVAFSGGGDSTALLHALRGHPQCGPAYIVDHGLRAGSDIEARQAAEMAREHGYDAKVLRWEPGGTVTSGLQEKARHARYRLLGNQSRKDGIAYLLTAHTEDDQAETLLMRYNRQTDWRGAAGMEAARYGAVWPQLAGVTLVRPLLDKARQDLREYNQTHGLTWLEDPSNQNRSFARIRARDYLRSRPRLRADLLETAREMRVGLREEKRLLLAEAKRVVSLDSHGVITLKKLCCAELLYHLLRVASGTGAPIDRAQIRRLRGDMARAGFTAATLAGAQVTRVKDRFVIARDPVFYLGRKDLGSQKGQPHHHTEILGKLSRKLSPDSPTIWDGRYSAAGSGHISAAGLMRGDLSSTETRALKAVAAPARGGVPVTQAKRDESRLIGAGVWGDIEVKSLVQTRLETALGGSFT